MRLWHHVMIRRFWSLRYYEQTVTDTCSLDTGGTNKNHMNTKARAQISRWDERGQPESIFSPLKICMSTYITMNVTVLCDSFFSKEIEVFVLFICLVFGKYGLHFFQRLIFRNGWSKALGAQDNMSSCRGVPTSNHQMIDTLPVTPPASDGLIFLRCRGVLKIKMGTDFENFHKDDKRSFFFFFF